MGTGWRGETYSKRHFLKPVRGLQMAKRPMLAIFGTLLAIFKHLTGTKTLPNHFYLVEEVLSSIWWVICENPLRIGFSASKGLKNGTKYWCLAIFKHLKAPKHYHFYLVEEVLSFNLVGHMWKSKLASGMTFLPLQVKNEAELATSLSNISYQCLLVTCHEPACELCSRHKFLLYSFVIYFYI